MIDIPCGDTPTQGTLYLCATNGRTTHSTVATRYYVLRITYYVTTVLLAVQCAVRCWSVNPCPAQNMPCNTILLDFSILSVNVGEALSTSDRSICYSPTYLTFLYLSCMFIYLHSCTIIVYVATSTVRAQSLSGDSAPVLNVALQYMSGVDGFFVTNQQKHNIVRVGLAVDLRQFKPAATS